MGRVDGGLTMNKLQLLRFSRICRGLPLGYKIEDTGAPRGERNLYVLRGPDGKVVTETFRLDALEKAVATLPATELRETK